MAPGTAMSESNEANAGRARATERAAGGWRRAAAPVSLAPAVDRLAEYARLGPDWDSYGSPPVSAVALAEGLRLLVAAQDRLAAVAGQNLVPYHVAPVPGGGVQFEWRGRSRDLEVHVASDGQLGTLLVEKSETGERYHEQQRVGHADVLGLIARVLEVYP